MSFAQNMQCFVIDRYYRYLNESFPRQAEDALLTAFHLYMFQQGNRGAQRAVRDGNPLDFVNYERYREVVSTEEMIKNDSPHGGDRILNPEIFEARTYVCTAHRLFRSLDTPMEAEKLFCHNVDVMNVKSFNPHIPYSIDSILRDCDVCVQRSPNPGCPEGTQIGIRIRTPLLSSLLWPISLFPWEKSSRLFSAKRAKR